MQNIRPRKEYDENYDYDDLGINYDNVYEPSKKKKELWYVTTASDLIPFSIPKKIGPVKKDVKYVHSYTHDQASNFEMFHMSNKTCKGIVQPRVTGYGIDFISSRGWLGSGVYTTHVTQEQLALKIQDADERKFELIRIVESSSCKLVHLADESKHFIGLAKLFCMWCMKIRRDGDEIPNVWMLQKLHDFGLTRVSLHNMIETREDFATTDELYRGCFRETPMSLLLYSWCGVHGVSSFNNYLYGTVFWRYKKAEALTPRVTTTDMHLYNDPVLG